MSVFRLLADSTELAHALLHIVKNATSFFLKTLGWFDDYCNATLEIQLSNKQIKFNLFESSLLLHCQILLKTEFTYLF